MKTSFDCVIRCVSPSTLDILPVILVTFFHEILKNRPEKKRSWVKYGAREARLKLITQWAKLASRHYEAIQPHKKKRRRLVSYTYELPIHFVVMSSKLTLSDLAQNIMMNPAPYHSMVMDIVLFVENGQERCAGAAVRI